MAGKASCRELTAAAREFYARVSPDDEDYSIAGFMMESIDEKIRTMAGKDSAVADPALLQRRFETSVDLYGTSELDRLLTWTKDVVPKGRYMAFRIYLLQAAIRHCYLRRE